MCLLAVQFRVVPDCPVLVAANREESMRRPSEPPAIRRGDPAVVSGLDLLAGGTWLGVNARGLLVAVTNRPRQHKIAIRSRGLLCQDLLRAPTALAATDAALAELATNRYGGANYLCVDARNCVVVHAGPTIEARHLEPGLHILTNADVDDPLDPRHMTVRRIFSPAGGQLATVRKGMQICGFRSDSIAQSPIVVRRAGWGTVSSAVVCLGTHPAQAAWWHCPGPPDSLPYQDCSRELRAILGTA